MKNINIIYWSESGNTEKIATEIEGKIKETENKVNLINVSNATKDDITSYDVIFLGSPATGDEEVDASEMMPFIESVSSIISGKDVCLFGSYGWGGGTFVESWIDVMKDFGANVIGNGIVCEGEPDDTCIKEIEDLVKEL